MVSPTYTCAYGFNYIFIKKKYIYRIPKHLKKNIYKLKRRNMYLLKRETLGRVPF